MSVPPPIMEGIIEPQPRPARLCRDAPITAPDKSVFEIRDWARKEEPTW